VGNIVGPFRTWHRNNRPAEKPWGSHYRPASEGNSRVLRERTRPLLTTQRLNLAARQAEKFEPITDPEVREFHSCQPSGTGDRPEKVANAHAVEVQDYQRLFGQVFTSLSFQENVIHQSVSTQESLSSPLR
jgi:hypothetical protein